MKIILTKLFTTLHCQRNKSATSRIFALADFKKKCGGAGFAPNITIFFGQISKFFEING